MKANPRRRMLMVGGAAGNFQGYQRPSADVYFWIDTSLVCFKKLIADFSVNKSFEEAYQQSEIVKLKKNNRLLIGCVISLEDLITSKIKSGRSKDLLDIQQLLKSN